MGYTGPRSRFVLSWNQKLRNWKPTSLRSALTERGQRLLRMRTDPRWMLFVTVLFLALLSGCATKPAQCLPTQPPKELMIPPPAPQAATNSLEAILRKGQTSAPTSTP